VGAPNHKAFAALQADGSITAWGDSRYGGTGAPTDSGYTKIYSTEWSFVALKADGSITAWGDLNNGGTGAPTDSGYIKIYSTPLFDSPHAVIEPSALRAAKAVSVE
jgi:alpha-tubulin suppressor-like RCC1 family protein